MSQPTTISVTNVTEIVRFGVGRLGTPKSLSSSRTDRSALFGAEPATCPARYGVRVLEAVRVAPRVRMLVRVAVPVGVI